VLYLMARGGSAARVGMQGETNPVEGTSRRGMRQIYRLVQHGGKGQIAARGIVSLRIMVRHTSDLSNDVAVHLMLNDYRTGLAYVETALDEADRETVIRNFRSGEYGDALRVIAFNPYRRVVAGRV
jgi:hypothetical protein